VATFDELRSKLSWNAVKYHVSRSSFPHLPLSKILGILIYRACFPSSNHRQRTGSTSTTSLLRKSYASHLRIGTTISIHKVPYFLCTGCAAMKLTYGAAIQIGAVSETKSSEHALILPHMMNCMGTRMHRRDQGLELLCEGPCHLCRSES